MRNKKEFEEIMAHILLIECLLGKFFQIDQKEANDFLEEVRGEIDKKW